MNKIQLITVLASVAEDNADAIAEILHASLPLREDLPERRRTERKELMVDGKQLFVEIGFYDDNRPAEIFLRVGKDGTDLREFCDAFAIVLSIALQHGIPLSAFPMRGEGNDLTGSGNRFIEAIFATMEELCTPSKAASVSSTPPNDSASIASSTSETSSSDAT